MVKNKKGENIIYSQIQEFIKNKYNLRNFHSCTIAEVLRRYNLTKRPAYNSKPNSKPHKSSELHLSYAEEALRYFQII